MNRRAAKVVAIVLFLATLFPVRYETPSSSGWTILLFQGSSLSLLAFVFLIAAFVILFLSTGLPGTSGTPAPGLSPSRSRNQLVCPICGSYYSDYQFCPRDATELRQPT